ncbi:hypothetical protein [Streptosporangium lutulentum]|uniref:Uncharacterized protein n=1 Tax=Streptosporangium lutulentum TaxID=1461250 RepID=A0ABT9QTI4_9ACTN|nr:hypothetical protein [Streptosporangium lutulentum]MDP9850060.1 hypothetical protein [Streptosporangium lutulentum]
MMVDSPRELPVVPAGPGAAGPVVARAGALARSGVPLAESRPVGA